MDDSKIRNMEQFASVSGISRPTVSKYFNDPGSVRPKTRARIEEALERYDYRPNMFAVNQNRRLTKNVGIVVPYLADPFFAEIARNIEQRCMQAGFWPTLFSAHGDSTLEVEILDSLRSLKPAGVLLAPLGRASDRAAIEKFCDDVPTILFDSNIEGVGDAFIGSDNTQIVRLSVDYLCRTGDAPCFFEMPPVNPNANKRRNGYIQAMEANGLEPQVIRVEGTGWGFEEVGYHGGLDILSKGLLTSDTVLCSNDRLAMGFLAACYERGLRVGHAKGCDLRVAGHDDHPFSRFGSPTLTTIAQDYEKISESSVEALFALIEGGRSDGPRIDRLFKGKLVMRASA
ncbi:LacI family DNA-binding transcriptional regulator [Pseudosulfitobacter koreensis]|uniref:LacI family transcriptional regulator n=1 Tax=Pseudosulfitobacter koreensis TaxID=2968472 RepID=A0ABT1YY60_9RHOB|nr:LacI family DNA-binding transcriptional regulator [Pseudosulfitobacter koreense]MCR8825817.1 LacI family transcriptional regulator [Pseudosulfitobacter koreense]